MTKGNYCGTDCACNDCCNTPEHDGEGGIRLEAIRYILSKKPDALTTELRALAHTGGWTIPDKPPKKAPFSTSKKSTKKTPVKSSAGRTLSKAKIRAGGAYISGPKLEEIDSGSDDEQKAAAAAIPFSTEEFPQLTLDENNDYGDLATSFKKPLFDTPNRPLEIAYSQHNAAKYQRKLAQQKKNAILVEYHKLKAKFQEKKLELSLANDEVRGHTQKVGAWTRKVFDLELEEDCTWNSNFRNLKEYKDVHGKLPPSVKKAKSEQEKALATWLDRM